jgi:hypothetical protein
MSSGRPGSQRGALPSWPLDGSAPKTVSQLHVERLNQLHETAWTRCYFLHHPDHHPTAPFLDRGVDRAADAMPNDKHERNFPYPDFSHLPTE